MSACRRRDGRPKQAYATEEEAARFSGPGHNAYCCTRCGQWHVGHTKAHGRPKLEQAFRRRERRRQRRKGSY